MAHIKTLDDLDPTDKRVLVRVDINVPMHNGNVTDDTRIRAVVPTIKELAKKKSKVILLAHFGRPKGKKNAEMSLQPIVPALTKAFGKTVKFAADTVGPAAQKAVADMAAGDILLLENTRFNPGEESNDADFSRKLADLGDVYVNDAFSAAHRAHGSTEGVAHLLPAYAGRVMAAELSALAEALEDPERPLVAVVGGAKISSKLDLLGNLTKFADSLIIGGGMANTFLAAQGKKIGTSLCEYDLLDTARDIMAGAEENDCTIILPVDVVVAKKFAAEAKNRTIDINDVAEKEMILDVGPVSLAVMSDAVLAARTLVWNGPLGAFEITPFDKGTVGLAKIAAGQSRADGLVTIGGGGDTVAALNHAKVAKDFSYISTAGGAFLEWLEGKELPGVEILSAD